MPILIHYTKKALKGRNSLSGKEKAILEALEQDLRENSRKTSGARLAKPGAGQAICHQRLALPFHPEQGGSLDN
jgi:hypothetical protein